MRDDKIHKIKMELADRYFVSTDEIYDHDVIDFLLAKLTAADDDLGKSFNANDELGMDNIKLREQIATIERETADKCAEICDDYFDHSIPAMGSYCYNNNIAMKIHKHFKLGE